jgi:hypothetical protein
MVTPREYNCVEWWNSSTDQQHTDWRKGQEEPAQGNRLYHSHRMRGAIAVLCAALAVGAMANPVRLPIVKKPNTRADLARAAVTRVRHACGDGEGI